jgi:hypothetical protein
LKSLPANFKGIRPTPNTSFEFAQNFNSLCFKNFASSFVATEQEHFVSSMVQLIAFSKLANDENCASISTLDMTLAQSDGYFCEINRTAEPSQDDLASDLELGKKISSDPGQSQIRQASLLMSAFRTMALGTVLAIIAFVCMDPLSLWALKIRSWRAVFLWFWLFTGIFDKSMKTEKYHRCCFFLRAFSAIFRN